MGKITNSLLVTVSIMLLTGCAGMFTGSNKSINVSSSDGKQVKAKIASSKGISDIMLPAVYQADRDQSGIYVSINDECYENYTYIVQSRLNWPFFINFFASAFGLTGTTMDVSSGNMWTYDDMSIIPTRLKDSCPESE
ncbi:MAG: hypothetical protein GY793_07645 [Proteobacteria bacterium]|nr:hypothetical protein [Pseudomonadota bacterium]